MNDWNHPEQGTMSGATTAGSPGSGEATTPPARSWDQVLGGALLLVVGVLWFLDVAAEVDVPWRALLPTLLVVVGLVTLVLATRRPTGELIGIGVVLTVLVVASALVPTQIGWTVGDQTEQPTSVAEAEEGFGHGVGNLEVDLTQLDTDEPVTVDVGLGIGELRIVVPDGVPLEVWATAAIGEVEVRDVRSSGVGAKVDERFDAEGDGSTLRVEASVGIGRVEVVTP